MECSSPNSNSAISKLSEVRFDHVTRCHAKVINANFSEKRDLCHTALTFLRATTAALVHANMLSENKWKCAVNGTSLQANTVTQKQS